MDNLIKEMENYAEEYNIPIMQKKGIDFLCKIIDKGEVKNILEIGTAIGYSAIKMANVNKVINVTSIERDQDRYIEALKNIKKAKLEKRINVIYGDALDINLEDKYDLIFIDAAKSQYIKFFNKYKENLNSKGIIISDNLSFHGFVEQKERIESRNLRQLVGKIRKYVDFLKENKEFKTKFYKVGDGIAVSIKED